MTKKWIHRDKSANIWECPTCKARIQLEGTPHEQGIHYCNKCGERLEEEKSGMNKCPEFNLEFEHDIKVNNHLFENLSNLCKGCYLSDKQQNAISSAISEYRSFYKNLYSECAIDIVQDILKRFNSLVYAILTYRNDFEETFGIELPRYLNERLDHAIDYLNELDMKVDE